MDAIRDILQDVPIAGIVALTVLAFAGLILWAAGQRALRWSLALIGGSFGATLGWSLAMQINLPTHPGIAASIGALGLALLAALSARLLVAGTMGTLAGLVAPLGVWTAVEFGWIEGPPSSDTSRAAHMAPNSDDDAAPINDEITRWLEARHNHPQDSHHHDLADSHESSPNGENAPDASQSPLAMQPLMPPLIDNFDLPPAAKQGIDEARGVVARLLNQVNELWDKTPEHLRQLLVAAAIIGALAGLLVGALLPKLCAAFVTAFGGSLLWLASGRILLTRLELPVNSALPDSVHIWLLIWLIVACAGLFIQWTIRPKPADN